MLKKIIMIIVISILLSILLITLLFSIFSEKKDTIKQKQITETQTIKPKEENPTPTKYIIQPPEFKIECKYKNLKNNKFNFRVDITRVPNPEFDEKNKQIFLEFDIVKLGESSYFDNVVDTTNLYPIDLSKDANLSLTIIFDENSKYINANQKKVLADQNIKEMYFSIYARDKEGKLLNIRNLMVNK